MKLHSVRIENFRAFKDETVFFDDYTCFVGPNGGGKSTVLCALNVFFRETENSTTDMVNLSIEDFHQKKTDEPIRITVTFTQLSDEAQKDFQDYFRQDKLIITADAEFSAATGRAEVKQYGQRLGMQEFRPFFEANKAGKLVAELREIYKNLREKHKDLPAETTKDAMTDALQVYEAKHPELSSPIESEDQFYGVSRGANRLTKYLQWIYIPAVKDVTTEQSESKNTAFGKLLARTVRLKLKFDEVIRALQEKTQAEYQEILNTHQDSLKDLENTLGEKLTLWAHPEASVKLEWQKDSKRSVQIEQPTAKTIAGEGGFEGDLARLGHGFQRSYLLALLQVLANVGGDQDAPRLILGCEEPELYQHPPQARHLASVLEHLSSQDAQILVCTHSPAFITGKGFENVRMVRFDTATEQSKCKHFTFGDVAKRIAVAKGEEPTKPTGIAAKLHQALQPGINEMFFAKNLVLVEGLEDVAYLTSWMVLTDRWQTFRQKGLHIVPVNGKSHLAQPLVVAEGLGIPVFIVFDADAHDQNHQAEHQRDNEFLLKLLGGDTANSLPKTTIWNDRYVIWPDNIAEVVKREIPSEKLTDYENKANNLYGNPGGLHKNGLQIAAKLQFAFEDGIKPASLEKLCDTVLAAAEA